VFDLGAEQARRKKEIGKVEARAPEEIIEGEREDAGGRRAKILEALDRLKAAT
jgi:hypothetical protein